MTQTPLTDALEAQEARGPLRAGTEGWWKVWGATMQDVRDGDLIIARVRRDDGTREDVQYAVRRIIPEDGILGAIWLRFITGTGDDRRLGRACPVVVYRHGTHNTLADSVR
jgi:hypothetical protein